MQVLHYCSCKYPYSSICKCQTDVFEHLYNYFTVEDLKGWKFCYSKKNQVKIASLDTQNAPSQR